MRLSGGRRYRQDYDALPDAACNVPLPGKHGKYGTLAHLNPGANRLSKETTYQINGKSFIVTPIFRTDSSETLAAVLMKLITAERGY